jgi:hypothetical protein
MGGQHGAVADPPIELDHDRRELLRPTEVAGARRELSEDTVTTRDVLIDSRAAAEPGPLLGQHLRTLVLAGVEGEPAQRRARAQAEVRVADVGKALLEPATPFLAVTQTHPELPRRAGNSKLELTLASRVRPGDRGAHVLRFVA